MPSASFRCSGGGIDEVARDVLAEEYDVGLENAPHNAGTLARRTSRSRRAIKLCISVGRSGGVELQPSGVQPNQFVLKFFPGRSFARTPCSGQDRGGHGGQSPFRFRRPDEAGRRSGSGRAQTCPSLPAWAKSAMGIVGKGPTETAPTNHTPRPIAPARRLVSHERLVCHGLLALPVPIGITIVRNAGIGAAAGPCEDEQPSMPFDEILK